MLPIRGEAISKHRDYFVFYLHSLKKSFIFFPLLSRVFIFCLFHQLPVLIVTEGRPLPPRIMLHVITASCCWESERERGGERNTNSPRLWTHRTYKLNREDRCSFHPWILLHKCRRLQILPVGYSGFILSAVQFYHLLLYHPPFLPLCHLSPLSSSLSIFSCSQVFSLASLTFFLHPTQPPPSPTNPSAVPPLDLFFSFSHSRLDRAEPIWPVYTGHCYMGRTVSLGKCSAVGL